MRDRRTYTREEMDAILRRAIERQQAKEDGVSHDELVAAAAEVGIPAEEVDAAARELTVTRDVRARVERERAWAVRRLVNNFIAWGIFSVVFLVLALKEHQIALLWPIFGWGIGVGVQAMRVLGARDGSESRSERRRRRREEKIRDFERTVEVGTEAIVRVIDAARRARENPPPVVREKIDFEPMTPTRLHAPVPPRMRVDVEPGDDPSEAPASTRSSSNRR